MDTSTNPNQTSQNQTGEIKWRQFGKHWIVVFVLAIMAGLVIWGMLNLGPWLKNIQDWRAAQVLKNQLEERRKNDKLGGQTPEDTFNLFISALEKNDTDLASRYFVSEKQEQWKKALDEYKAKSLLTDFIKELNNAEKNWRKVTTGDLNMAEFNYTITIKQDMSTTINGQPVLIKAGVYTSNLLFEKYPNRNWKINDIQ